jgi:tetratricopeptide (TPR) repeat protein
VNAQGRQSALATLAQLRPTAERLLHDRDPEDRAADLIDIWTGVEGALRQLLGGSALSGQALIRELRVREAISLQQAHALLDLQAVRERVENADYRPTDADVTAAQTAVSTLSAELAAPPAPPTYQQTTPDFVPAQPAPRPVPEPGVTLPSRAARAGIRGIPIWAIAAAVVLLVVVIAGAVMYSGGSTDRAIESAASMMAGGQREAARSEFSRIARENPTLAVPHVFLSRLSRDEGDLGTAHREAETALRLEPANALALREMASVLYVEKQYELARRFYIRAVQANPEDKMAQGMLGCTLIRLNRIEEGTRFINRAGAGAWSSCLPSTLGPSAPPTF